MKRRGFLQTLAAVPLVGSLITREVEPNLSKRVAHNQKAVADTSTKLMLLQLRRAGIPVDDAVIKRAWGLEDA